jgi:predicted ATPase/DNA-binding SARP family transcriptional activator/tetratricopeptide (TPR) repeat protein
MPECLELHLLGGVAIAIESKPLAALRSQKAIALLIYLACTRRAHSRELLADLLWDATSTAQSLSNLRTVLARLRRHLGYYLLVTPETIALAPGAPLALDVRTLEEQIAALPRHLSPAAALQMEQALASYQGDFLAGFHLEGATGFEDWALVERERFRFSVLEALRQLADHCVHTGNVAAGLRVTARLLALDPLDEAAHAQRLRLLAASGQRAAALVHYDACRQLLLDELGVEPDDALQALYAQIRDGALAPATAPSPAIATQPLAHHNLPELPTSLLGRDRTMAAIQARLRDAAIRLVTLIGEGGVGKSRLALAVGQQMLDAWPDGVWFVPLVAITTAPQTTLPNRLATAVAAAIQLPFASSGKGADSVIQLCDYLRDKELLLILDNFEHLTAGASFVGEVLRHAPRGRVLVTSREPLHIDAESVLPLQGLTTPQPGAQTLAAVANFASVQLFVERARRTQPAFALTAENAGAVAQLCRLVDGSPLALELAAPWVDHFGVDEMVAILARGGFEFLTSAAPTADPRHRSLHTVFVTSWNLLHPSAQQTLAQLAVFRGGFHREALLAVTDATLTDLQRLVSQSLLWHKGSGRYEIHELLRQFAAAQLETLERTTASSGTASGGSASGGSASGGPVSAARHCRYYLALVGAEMNRGPQANAALALLQDDIDNIRHAWRWAIANHDLAALAVGWRGLQDFYLHKMLFAEAEEAFRSGGELLQALPTTTPAHQPLLATLQVAQAVFLNMLTRYDEASGLAQAAIAFAETACDAAVKASGYLQWGTALYRRGRYDDALERFHLARLAAIAAHLKPVEGDIQRLIGITLLEKSEFGTARQQLEQALAIYRQVGNRLGEGNALNDLGWLGQREQNFTDALAYLQAARRVHQAIGNRHGVSIVLINLGIVHEMLGEYSQAYACFEEMQQLLQELDDRYQRSLLNHSLGVLLARVGDYATAHTHYLRALEIDHELGDRVGMAWTQNGLGLLYNHLGDAKTALAYHKEALRTSKECGARTVQGIAHLGIGQDLYELGNLEAAGAAFRAARAVAEELGQTVRAVEASSGLARTLLALKQSSAALMEINSVLDYLATHTLQGARQPFLVYLDCYRVLAANDDLRAPALLREAYLNLQQQADRIADDAWRNAYLQNIQAHQALTQAYRTLTLAGGSMHPLDDRPAARQARNYRPQK